MPLRLFRQMLLVQQVSTLTQPEGWMPQQDQGIV